MKMQYNVYKIRVTRFFFLSSCYLRTKQQQTTLNDNMQNDYSPLSDDDSENGEVTNFKAITGEARKELEDN